MQLYPHVCTQSLDLGSFLLEPFLVRDAVHGGVMICDVFCILCTHMKHPWIHQARVCMCVCVRAHMYTHFAHYG